MTPAPTLIGLLVGGRLLQPGLRLRQLLFVGAVVVHHVLPLGQQALGGHVQLLVPRRQLLHLHAKTTEGVMKMVVILTLLISGRKFHTKKKTQYLLEKDETVRVLKCPSVFLYTTALYSVPLSCVLGWCFALRLYLSVDALQAGELSQIVTAVDQLVDVGLASHDGLSCRLQPLQYLRLTQTGHVSSATL